MKKIVIILLVLVGACLGASAQGRKSVRINEVVVLNDSGYMDDYGRYPAWIELFNTNFAPVEISSIFITNDRNNVKKYPVPLGDVNTRIPKRQHVVFWADGKPSRGTFHTNIVFTPGQENWIGIYDADGSLIDEITVPADLLPGYSYARKVDGEGGINNPEDWEIRDGSIEHTVTPSSANLLRETNKKVEMFAEQDENGFGMAIIAMCIVFCALLLLSTCFYIISKIGAKITRRNKAASQGINLKEVEKAERPTHDTGEEIAAIAMALHDHLNAHDSENTILTINKVKRAYSPWNSKIYSLRETPRR
jgi:hypothetical protein